MDVHFFMKNETSKLTVVVISHFVLRFIFSLMLFLD